MENSLPTYAQLLRLAWRQYVLRFDVILWSIMLFGLPSFILLDLTTPVLPADLPMDDFSYVQAYLSQPMFWLNAAISLLCNALLTFSSLMIVVALFQTFQRKEVVWKEVLQIARGFFWRGLLVNVVVTLVTLVAFSALIIPGVIVGVFLNFALPALVWQNTTTLGALRVSWSIVKSHWWRVFGYVVWTELGILVFSVAVTSFLPNSLGFRTASLLLTAIISSFATVLYVLCFTALYTEKAISATPNTPPNTSN